MEIELVVLNISVTHMVWKWEAIGGGRLIEMVINGEVTEMVGWPLGQLTQNHYIVHSLS